MTDAKPAKVRLVHSDLSCRECGYNLRGLRHEQTCPECGTDVEWSTHGHLLRYASVRWLRHLYRGTVLLIAAAVLTFFATFAITLNAFGLTHGGLEHIMCLLFLHTTSALGIIGVWYITTVEPRVRAEENLHSSRRITRLLCIITALCWLMLAIDQMTRSYGRHGSPYDFHPPHWAAVISWLLLLPMSLGQLSIIGKRSSFLGMEERIKSLVVVYFFFAGTLITYGLLAKGGSENECCIWCGSVVAGWIFTSGLLFNLSEFRSELRTSIRISASRPWRAPSTRSTPSDNDTQPTATEES